VWSRCRISNQNATRVETETESSRSKKEPATLPEQTYPLRLPCAESSNDTPAAKYLQGPAVAHLTLRLGGYFVTSLLLSVLSSTQGASTRLLPGTRPKRELD